MPSLLKHCRGTFALRYALEGANKGGGRGEGNVDSRSNKLNYRERTRIKMNGTAEICVSSGLLIPFTRVW